MHKNRIRTDSLIVAKYVFAIHICTYNSFAHGWYGQSIPILHAFLW